MQKHVRIPLLQRTPSLATRLLALIDAVTRYDKDLLAAPAVKTPDVCLWCAFGTLGQGALCLCMSTSGGRELNRSYSPLHCTWNMLSLVFCILPSLVRTTVELSCGGDVWCFPVVSTHQNKTKTLTGPCIRTTSSIKLIIAFTYVKTHIASIFEIKKTSVWVPLTS